MSEEKTERSPILASALTDAKPIQRPSTADAFAPRPVFFYFTRNGLIIAGAIVLVAITTVVLGFALTILM